MEILNETRLRWALYRNSSREQRVIARRFATYVVNPEEIVEAAVVAASEGNVARTAAMLRKVKWFKFREEIFANVLDKRVLQTGNLSDISLAAKWRGRIRPQTVSLDKSS